MIFAEKELLPGGSGSPIAKLLRQRKQDGRLVEVTVVVRNEKHRPSQFGQLVSPVYFKRDKTPEQRVGNEVSPIMRSPLKKPNSSRNGNGRGGLTFPRFATICRRSATFVSGPIWESSISRRYSCSRKLTSSSRSMEVSPRSATSSGFLADLCGARTGHPGEQVEQAVLADGGIAPLAPLFDLLLHRELLDLQGRGLGKFRFTPDGVAGNLVRRVQRLFAWADDLFR